jgi:DNA-binding GntR family transcriptional regulator
VREGIEIAEVRRELEGLCARLAAERATKAERTGLGEVIAEMHAAFAGRDMNRYLAANSAFHTAIHAMSRHHVAAGILTQLGNLNLNRHFPVAFGAPVPSGSMTEHERVAQAIAIGDADAAEQAMREHLEGLIEVLRAQEAAQSNAQAAG